jgi:hypothetical protein
MWSDLQCALPEDDVTSLEMAMIVSGSGDETSHTTGDDPPGNEGMKRRQASIFIRKDV